MKSVGMLEGRGHQSQDGKGAKRRGGGKRQGRGNEGRGKEGQEGGFLIFCVRAE